ncbi:bifunctional diaminohydroxyphosphoribosylaminopyrimidine deaminase/5-amino-6-(5-phosphoribosylamino)uracil reductase RibD [Thermodesulfovibrio thiophilus]|uniref:bifunctional diaminohydroxyphosphoribosylaminopyrimidine deaminase/5-amino-6-(5-phosphoribosylamino)uracil reductase RibD n=1 Tax=Thermodesulfovibrio thiophilus TaxID=340095 RepID=UPI001821B2C2|nr:bifunctional diaminohydroxyphosphoribosylaminopyrimidine deaminase/5-amino-6-(5-phosphoribosylamino)uracil reductase RibD [Thermodesulfovibrio thiophilus]HHW20953.1 bifunctional diaminohydroxyphosphoribosylaminopyrimidine deaminase/5-amino-6-(5-phosphoribosylamino)uracil reductase RibD [Thermodesulfovibrio thiophilus]
MRDDRFFMKKALLLAKKAGWKTSPNPMVGAVIVKNGEIISKGFHKKAGLPHAEAEAIMNAKQSIKGATLYVNLEPCCHRDKKTPPCTDAIINSGIKRVVIAMKDPNPKVSGKGIEILRNNKIEVIEGILEDEAKKLNEFYIKYITTNTPFVILKIAMTLDGKIATPSGESKWITSEKSRKLVHIMRGRVDAILSAYGTILKDNPLFTARVKDSKNPVRVIIDPELKIPLNYHVYNPPPDTIVVVNERKLKNSKLECLRQKGIEVIHFSSDKVDLKWLMEELAKRHIMSVMIEGGSSLNSYALWNGIVDKIMIFVAPKIIGGAQSYPSVGGKVYKNLDEAFIIKDLKIKRLANDILIEGHIETG